MVRIYLAIFFSLFVFCKGQTVLEYVGCYNDEGTRYFPHQAASTGALTPFLCVSTCGNLGFLFAGAQNGNECWCGNTFGGYGKAQESRCAKPCPSYTVAFCGNSWVNAIYRTKGYELGCFEVQDARPSLFSVTDILMTSHVCISECFKRFSRYWDKQSFQNYRYAALKDGATCQCLNTTDPVSPRRVDGTQCQNACAGDGSLTCGGNDTQTLYDLNLDAGDYAATVQNCSASTEYSDPFACDGAFDGIALEKKNEWASLGQGPGAWIKAQFDRSYILKGLQVHQRYADVEQSKDIRLVFDSGHMDFTLQEKVVGGYLWDYLDIVPSVLTSSVRLEILTVYTKTNNGFIELIFVTNNELLAITNPSGEPDAINVVDGSNTTCFGLDDRQNKNVARVELISFNQDQSFIEVSFDRIVSCSQSLNHQMIISAMFNKSHECPYHKKCDLTSEGLTDNACVVMCLCKYSPCEMHVLFEPSSTLKICDLKIN